ncbi:ankyrin repeat domain-containing protein 45 isoform X1 [Ahaetulla prasina]|uniref:ankyrin repeat domain-containing protein 45 isoform X1 n=2 Tax=Ahaetulla prasina TaxID=499056 RepID=UPI0026474232|nr:ankyrin repeat domain-containing protein 45 isoform X1 [Ahaetulla prasina]XP_058034304.1 ankyrin repeat domain-containing protein 45 isoform X1 [Ahaetulla prasina]XP_058034305.1 ankyrin repeat domain-containing protein 45 isoform X1 [Ahaetulla prasina]
MATGLLVVVVVFQQPGHIGGLGTHSEVDFELGQDETASESNAANLVKMEPFEETAASTTTNEHEDLGPQEEPEHFNLLLRAALRGDIEEVQQIFEDSEDPDHEKANKFLMEKDILGRNLLFTTCMVGQNDVIQSLAKYGVDLKDKTVRGYTLLHSAAAWGQLNTLKSLVELEADIYATTFRGENAREIANRYKQTECVEFLDWAEAKQNLRNFIFQIQATITDPEKVQGKLNKEDKSTSIKACQAKLDWLENTKEPNTQEFIDQKQQLEDIMLPIFTKLAAPRGQDFVVSKKT